MNVLTEEDFHTDARRTIRQLLTADIKQINFYSANKGAILGNHYHKDTVEYFYITKGTVCYNESRVFNPGDLFVVYPEENHALEVMSKMACFMTFLSKPYTKKEPDTYGKSNSL